MSSVGSLSSTLLLNTFFRSARSKIPTLSLLCRDAVTRATAALRALSDHGGPARSPTARSASHTSALRSSTPSGIVGQKSPTSSSCADDDHDASRLYSFLASGPLTRGRQGSTRSSLVRRRIRTITL